MAENKKPKEHLSWWYFLAKYVMLFFFKILHPYRIIGRENMPLTGKLLVCSNHVTMGDPIYLGCAIPKRQLHYMAKAELFENKLIGGFLKSLGAFPISRGTAGHRVFRRRLTFWRKKRSCACSRRVRARRPASF